MKELVLGQVVVSKAGRDQGNYFIVVDIAEPFVFLCDGKVRRLDSPKKKKIKHIQPTNHVDIEMQISLREERRINNADIRKSLSQYLKSEKPEA